MRICVRCKQDRDESEFHVRRETGALRGTCKPCQREQKRGWRAEHLDESRRRTREWMSSPQGRFRHLRQKFGLTPEAYNTMLVQQGEACEVCRIAFDKTPHVDHDHATGRVRALLCGHCNRALGHARDNAETLRALAAYLDRHRAMAMS